MPNAEWKNNVDVNKDAFFATITDYEAYPKFVDGCTKAVIKEKANGKAVVQYFISVMMKDISYTLEHTEDAANGVMSWKLKDSAFMKNNTGAWKLESKSPTQTTVSYQVDLDFTFPAPGFMVKKLIQGSLPKMMDNFTSEAKKRKV